MTQLAAEAEGLQTKIASLTLVARRRHRRANWTFLFAGLAFGTVLYLAKTRFSIYFHQGRMGPWLVVLFVALASFALAAWFHSRALSADEEIRDLEDALCELPGDDGEPEERDVL